MRALWADSVAAGVDDSLFWGLTPVELRALLEARGERESVRERRADIRAGVIAMTIANTTPGMKKRYKVDDFFPEPKKEERRLTRHTFEAWLHSRGHRRVEA